MHPKLKAWAQLIRIPNTLTACADSLAGFSIAAGSWFQYESIWGSLLLLSLGSICLYWAGMILNDVHDVDADRANRRLGPLVDGRISVSTAQGAGWGLLLMGISFAFASTFLLPSFDALSALPKWSVLLVALLLSATIVAYDSQLKATVVGPIFMGLCRGWNLFLGFVLGACLVPIQTEEWYVIATAAAGLALFVMGITLAARRESFAIQSKSKILAGWIVSVMGAGCIAACSYLATNRELNLDSTLIFPLLILLLCGPWLRRALYSVQRTGIETLVPAIKQAILTIIYLDAALSLQFAGNYSGAIICFLAIPTWAMSRYFRVT